MASRKAFFLIVLMKEYYLSSLHNFFSLCVLNSYMVFIVNLLENPFSWNLHLERKKIQSPFFLTLWSYSPQKINPKTKTKHTLSESIFLYIFVKYKP